MASSGLDLQLYAFNASGTLLPLPGKPPRAADLVTDGWSILLRTGRRLDMFRAKEIDTLFGSGFEFPALKARAGTAMPVYGAAGNGLLYWEPLASPPVDSVLIALWDRPAPEIFLRLALQERPEPGLVLLGEGPGGRRTTFAAIPGLPVPDGLPAQPPEGEAGREAGLPDDWSLAWDRHGGLRLIAAEPYPPGPHRGWSTALDVLLSCLVLGLAAALARWGTPAALARLPLRARLTGLFLYLTLIGLAALAALALSHFREREEVLVAEAQRAALERLTRIDQGFGAEKERFLRDLREFARDPGFRRNPAGMRDKAILYERARRLNWLEARDLNGNLLFTTERPDLTQKIGVLARVLSRRFIDLFLSDRLRPSQKVRIDPAELVITSILDSPLTGWVHITNAPDTVHELKFGDYDLWWWWTYFRDPTSPAAILQADQKLEQVIPPYLTRVLLEREGIDQAALRVAAWSLNRSQFVPAEPVSLPAPLRAFAQRVRIVGEPLQIRFAWQGEDFLAVGAPARQIKRHLLLAWYPMSAIRSSLAGIRFALALGMALALVVALLLGGIFTDTLVTPLRELMRGVEALRARNVSVRLQVDSDDEFGELGRSFNRTIEEIGELVFAQSVQNRLMPIVPPVIEGCQLAVVNRAAADLGGDFFDIVPLPDGRVLFCIGDVTGHGVASALVMAMAKAATWSWSRTGQPLIPLMQRLNRLFHRLLRRQKLMTFFALLLDPATGRMTFSNAGHPQPLVLAPDGTITRLDLPHSPLGFSERAPFETADAVLPPGAALLLFTDGLLELPPEQPWLMAGLETFLRARPPAAADELRDALLAEAIHRNGGPSFPDDVTFVVVRRNTETAIP